MELKHESEVSQQSFTLNMWERGATYSMEHISNTLLQFCNTTIIFNFGLRTILEIAAVPFMQDTYIFH